MQVSQRAKAPNDLPTRTRTSVSKGILGPGSLTDEAAYKLIED